MRENNETYERQKSDDNTENEKMFVRYETDTHRNVRSKCDLFF